jgi:hypothetical protein
MLEKAKRLAEENYESWGQWVIECMSDSDILKSIGTQTLEEWVEIQESVAGIYREVENSKF